MKDGAGKIDRKNLGRTFFFLCIAGLIGACAISDPAYAQGKDGITDLKFNREGGLFHNCWFIQNGEAVGFRVNQRKK